MLCAQRSAARAKETCVWLLPVERQSLGPLNSVRKRVGVSRRRTECLEQTEPLPAGIEVDESYQQWSWGVEDASRNPYGQVKTARNTRVR